MLLLDSNAVIWAVLVLIILFSVHIEFLVLVAEQSFVYIFYLCRIKLLVHQGF